MVVLLISRFAPNPTTRHTSVPTINSVPRMSKRPCARSCFAPRSTHHVRTSAISVTGMLIQNSARQSGAPQFKPRLAKKSMKPCLLAANQLTMMPPYRCPSTHPSVSTAPITPSGCARLCAGNRSPTNARLIGTSAPAPSACTIRPMMIDNKAIAPGSGSCALYAVGEVVQKSGESLSRFRIDFRDEE